MGRVFFWAGMSVKLCLKGPNSSVCHNLIWEDPSSYIYVCIYEREWVYIYICIGFSVYPPCFLIPGELHLKLAAGEAAVGHWMLRV